MKKSVSKRIRITKNGKIMRRAMGQDHCRSKRSSAQARRKLGSRSLADGMRILIKYT